jgi:hypothetical protein
VFLDQKADWEAVGLECGAASWKLYRGTRRIKHCQKSSNALSPEIACRSLKQVQSCWNSQYVLADSKRLCSITYQ